ncbi:MAG TPA: hypothetical protein VFA77_07975 [Candidatus Eisenbacteria bacterium]|jgi:hypothetical protein|nr:hypothetical protein [Candidatus Eisenbacteria bacterium]
MPKIRREIYQRLDAACRRNDFASLEKGFASLQIGLASKRGGLASKEIGLASKQNGFASKQTLAWLQKDFVNQQQFSASKQNTSALLQSGKAN